MPPKGRLESKIVTWLQRDGHKVDIQAHDDSVEFHLTINNLFKKAVDIGIFKYKKDDFVRILTTFVPNDNILASYKKFASTSQTSQSIIQGLHRELLKINIDHSIEHNLTEIILVEDIYVYNTTKAELIDAIKKVRNASMYVLSVLNEKFGTVTESQSSTNYRMYT